MLILADEILPLAYSWQGTSAQWNAVIIATILMGPLVVYLLMQAAILIGVWRLGAGDVRRGRQILAARMAARDARRKAT